MITEAADQNLLDPSQLPEAHERKGSKNKKLILILALALFFIAGVVVYLLLSRTPTPSSLPEVIQNSPTPETPLRTWKSYDIPDCLVSFEYPPEWEGAISPQLDCTVRYTPSRSSDTPTDTLVFFRVLPVYFMDQLNVEIDPDKIIETKRINGIDVVIEYTEEKDANSTKILAVKRYLFKREPVFFEIMAQYDSADKEFEELMDTVASTVIIKGDEAFYEDFVKEQEDKLQRFIPTDSN